jgi:hypothetical protein
MARWDPAPRSSPAPAPAPARPPALPTPYLLPCWRSVPEIEIGRNVPTDGEPRETGRSRGRNSASLLDDDSSMIPTRKIGSHPKPP